MPIDISEVEVALEHLTLRGLRITTGETPARRHQVLGIHGWLDNANSFIPLAGSLDNIDLLAIDLPGHGLSDHLPAAASYHFVDTPAWLFQVADAVDWGQFHWLGHSLGGCLAPFAAVAHPERIQSIMMLEASGPLTEVPTRLPARLHKSSQEKTRVDSFKSRTLRSVEDGIAARLKATKMTPAAARLIVERQLREVADGFVWRFDPRHRMTSPLYLAEAHVHAILEAVQCPALVVSALDGYLRQRPDTRSRLDLFKAIIHREVPGHHHMHMDDPGPSASAINAFLREHA